MISDVNKKERKKVCFVVLCILTVLLTLSVCSIAFGQYSLNFFDTLKALSNIIFNTKYDVPQTAEKVIQYIRMPRTVAAFLVGSSLAVAGAAYQTTFNNKLVSPDVLGVSAGSCVGAAISILCGVGSYFVGIFAFVSGMLSVFLALLLPKLFRSNKTITLVLSGIIVGSLMDSIIGVIKFISDKDDKLAEITFWMMGSLAGITFKEIISALPIYAIAIAGLFLLRWKMNTLSLGESEAKSLGLNYRLYRLLVIVCSTLLTAASVSLCGNVGWIGLVVPHISRAIVGSDNRYSIPISFLFGGTFMILVDMLSRNLTVNEIPLSIITGILGTVIYAVVLIKRGRELNE